MLDRAIVIIFGVVFLLTICLSMFGIIFTLVQEIQFESVCKNTLNKIDLDGGLTYSARSKLVQSLKDKGYKNITVTAPINIQYGEIIIFKVDAEKGKVASQKLLIFLGFVEESHYESKIISRKIHNLAFQ